MASNSLKAGHDIVVIGGSAGAMEALLRLVRVLPADLPATLFLVLHTSADAPGVLPEFLGRSGALPAAYARDNHRFKQGCLYVAPPDHHLLLADGVMRVTRGPKENGFRPAVDPLFRTAARSYGPRVVGIVLSGGLDDGTHGLSVIKSEGGVAIVQDPAEALVRSMPTSASQFVEIDYSVGAAQIGALIARLAHEAIPPGVVLPENGAMDDDDILVPDLAKMGSDALKEPLYEHPPSAFTCPECGGALWEVSGDEQLRYRCHVGHTYSGNGLLAGQDRGIEEALWAAVRVLDENAALNRRMAEKARAAQMEGLLAAYRKRAESAEQRAKVIRAVLVEAESADALELSRRPVPPVGAMRRRGARKKSRRSRKTRQ